MNILLGTFLVLISLFLFTYYLMKANNDDLNRPSFFNSKKRKYFLLFFMIVMFAGGEYLITLEKSYYWMGLPLIFYYLVYYFIKKDSTKNIIIKKTFNFFKVFSQPYISFSKEDHLTAPVELLVAYGGMEKDTRNKVHEYLEKRVKEGKIKTARDLPQEAWTIIGCTGKEEIKENPTNVLPQRKIDYYYEEIIEGKEHKNLLKSFLDFLWNAELQLERIFDNFAFISQPRPDFTEVEVCFSDGNDVLREDFDKSGIAEKLAVFPSVSLMIAKKFGWVKGAEEYSFLAALEFSRRYPKHKFSKEIRKKYKFTNKQIFDYAQNWERLDMKKS